MKKINAVSKLLALGIFTLVGFSFATILKDAIGDKWSSLFSFDSTPKPAKAIHDSGSAGTNTTWSFDSDTGILRFEGSGSVTTSYAGSAPWYKYRSYVKEIIVSDEVTSLGNSIYAPFYGFDSVEKMTIPFVGTSRSATNYSGVFGVIFGETSLDSYTSTSSYNYVFDAKTHSGMVYGYNVFNSTSSREYVDSVVSSSTTYTIPSGKTFQYSCYNGYRGKSSSSSSTTSSYALCSYFYSIPQSLKIVNITDATRIPDCAFLNCSNLLKISINSGVASIGKHAFRDCTALENLELPDSVTSIGDYAFYRCNKIKSFNMGNGVQTIGAYSFAYMSKLKDLTFSKSLISISTCAFENCTSLTSIALPESLTTIGLESFSGLTNVKNLYLPEGLQTIGRNAFKGMSKIKSVVVPKSVTTIDSGAFNGCNSLESISLPFVGGSRTSTAYEGVFGFIFGYTTLDSYTGSSSSNSNYVYYASTLNESTREAGYNIYSTSAKTSYVDRVVSSRSSSTYTVPTGTTFQYSCYNGYTGKSYSSSSTTTSVALRSYFYYIPATLKKVSITDATNIPVAAFRGCSTIEEFDLNNAIESVEDWAFWQSSIPTLNDEEYMIRGNVLIGYNGSSENVVIPSNVRVIASRAFYNNDNIKTVTIPESVYYVGAYAFYSCGNLTVNIPKKSGSFTTGSSAFYGVSNTTYLTYDSYTNGKDTFYYSLNEHDEATIVGCSTTSTAISLPTTINDYPVIGVGFKGMANCTSLTSVTIPSNITFIDSFAFSGCTGLTTITIPSSVLTIREQAFKGCTNLHSVTIAEGVKYIGDFVFYDCISLAEIVVPDTCEYLGGYAFYNCTSLETATIGITVPEIKDYTFYNCTSLASAVVGLSVTKIGDYAFYKCNLARLTAPNVLKTIGKYAFAYNESLARVTLRNKLETIDVAAFKGCIALATINWPASIKEIGALAFSGCASLPSATIPALVTKINDYVFENCTSLASVTINGQITYIGDFAFYNTAISSFNFGSVLQTIGEGAFKKTQLVSITLPDSLQTIGASAFANCSLLEFIDISDSVTIGYYAFYNNAENLHANIRYLSGIVTPYMFYHSSVQSVTMDNNITEIGDYAFANCFNLTEFNFPSELLTIGDYSFYFNLYADELTLPNKTQSIGSNAFAMDYSLEKLSIPDTVQTVGASAFYNNFIYRPELTIEIYYVDGGVDDALLKQQHIDHILVDDEIYELGSEAFSSVNNLNDIRLPDTITTCEDNVFAGSYITVIIENCDGKIDDAVYQGKMSDVVTLRIVGTNVGKDTFRENTSIRNIYISEHADVDTYAFYSISSLQNVYISGETEIGNYAFAENINLINVEISGTSNIGDYAFYNDIALKHCYTTGTVVNIGKHAFEECKALLEMQLPETVRYIGDYAFYDCNAMVSINVPNGVPNINQYTFFGCASLTGIELPVSIATIDDYAFYGCVSATSINIPNHCNKIGDYVFYNCKKLESLNIPLSMTSIGDYAFRSCIALTELEIPDSVTELGVCAFYDCNGLQDVILGRGITQLKDRMFYGCVNLTDLYILSHLTYINELAFYGAEDVVCHISRDTYMENFFNENGIMYELEYFVVFANYDGSKLYTATYHIGDQIVDPGLTPTRPADSTYTYTFAGWNKELGTCSGDETFTATYTPTYIDYTVTFVNYNGDVISSSTYHYGDSVVAPAENPTKSADNTYTYTFAGWDSEVVACDGDKTYTATYTPVYIEYTVQFVNYNGDTISSTTYHYGDTVATPAEDPTKAADDTYTYTFASWDSEVVACDGNKTYTAVYTPVYIEYTVIFANYNGDTISSTTYHYGDEVVAPSEDPTKPSDNTYSYSFAGWDSEVVACDGNKTYTAVYTPIYIEYAVTFIGYDGLPYEVLYFHYGDQIVAPDEDPTKPSDNTYSYSFAGWNKDLGICNGEDSYTATFNNSYIDYTIQFVNYDGEVISTATYHYGDTIVVPGENPTRPADSTYTYAFNGWDSEVVACDGDKTYTATYDGTYIDYTVTFVNYNGDTISSATYHYGEAVTAPSDNPSKPADSTYTYEFTGWDSEVVDCDGNKTYTATYNPIYIEYAITFLNYDGSEYMVVYYHYGDQIVTPDEDPTKPSDNTYSYTFAGWNKDLGICNGEDSYTATFNSTYAEYVVQFVDYDGTVISSATYHYGDEVAAPAEDPTRIADNTFTYEFTGWDSEVVDCDGNKTYTATYTGTYIDYTVNFVNYDGKTISSAIYHYGDEVVAPAENPSKSADETYTYSFAGWDSEVVDCDGNKTYTAVYTPVFIEYLVEFVDYNGDVISSNAYHYGDEVVAPAEDPIRSADNTYTYEFNGWDSNVVDCDGDKTYTATYTSTYIDYTVEFVNYDGELISTATYHYGDEIVVPGEDPSKPSDETYTYEFNGWDSNVVDCDGDKTYTAVYTPVYIEYTIVFTNYDGSQYVAGHYHYGDQIVVPSQNPAKPADNTYTYEFAGWDKTVGVCTGSESFDPVFTPVYIEYTITFLNYDGSELSSRTYHYGDTVLIPVDPTRSADSRYTYVFNGWDSEVSAVNGNKTYIAVFDNIYIDYVVQFVNYNGDVISSRTYHYGDEVVAPSIAPTKQSDNTYTYEFAGWDSSVTNVYGDKTYTATYNPVYINYMVTFVNYDGETISSATYHYGDAVTAPAQNPTRSADNTYTYTFASWDSSVVACDGNKTYTAVYTPIYIDYVVQFVNYNGDVISSKTYHYGDAVTAPAQNPTRSADNTYTYTFAGWDSSVVACDSNKTYTATYINIYIEYTVTFLNEDGSTFNTAKYHYGDQIVAPTQNPSKPDDAMYTYTFAGWNNELGVCHGDVTFTATYTKAYSADYLSGQLREQLLDEIDDIEDIDLSTYAVISSIESRMSELNETDRAAVQVELDKVIAQYNAFVKTINDEYKESSSIFNALIFGAALASTSLLGLGLFLIKRRFML